MNPILFIIFFLSFLVSAFAARISLEPVVFFDFTEIVGTTIADKGQGVPALNLEITEPGKAEWLNPGLRIKEGVLVKTNSDRTKLDYNLFFENGITIEVWIKPVNNTQSGPARIVTFSKDSKDRNFTLGQSGSKYDQRFRTTDNPGNGTNTSTKTPEESIGVVPVLQHVVYTRDNRGNAKMYIDAVKVTEVAIPGGGENWDSSYGFGLFNETSYPVDKRSWMGDIFLVAIYQQALNAADVKQNFEAGISGAIETDEITLAWDANVEDDLAGYRIYYGSTSRFDPALAEKLPAIIKKNCQFPAEGDPSESQKECYETWIEYCKCAKWEFIAGVSTGKCSEIPNPVDPMCDSDYFSYDNQIDVKNVLEYTVKGLAKDGEYYFAATAYDTGYPKRNHESKFSVELNSVHEKHFGEIDNPKNIRIIGGE